MHRKRSRLAGGHKVGGAVQPLTQPNYGQMSNAPSQGLPPQYGTSHQPQQPPLPQPSQLMMPQQQSWQQQQQQHQHQHQQHQHQQHQHQQHQQHEHQQQKPPENNWGWDSESSGAWNWGDSDEGRSSGPPQHPQQQPQQEYPQHYNQPHAYPHHQQPSQPNPQQRFHKPAENTTYGHMPTPTSRSQSQPQQYMNGSSQNGNNVDEWNNWGDDWGSFDNYNNNTVNNNNSKPATYRKEDSASESHQNYHSYQQQLYQQQQHQQQHQQHLHQQQQHQQQQQEQYTQKPPQQLHHNQYTPQQPQYTAQQPSQQNLHHEQPSDKSQQLSKQEYGSHYQHQPQQERTQQQTDDNWEWGNDDWQVNGQVTEQPQEPAAPQPQQQATRKPSGESAGHIEARVSPQSAVNTTSAAGDGWPDWEEQTHVTASQMPQQQHEGSHSHTAESASYPGGEESVATHQDVSHWSQQHWEGSWGHADTVEGAADHHTVAHTSTAATTTTTAAELQSCSQYDSYQQKHVENAAGYEAPDEEQMTPQQEHHSTSIASTASGTHVQPSDTTTTTTTATSIQPSTIMMNNFDDDNWGDGWGEVEAPLTTQAPHTVSESASLPADSHDYAHHHPAVSQPTSYSEDAPHAHPHTHPETHQHTDLEQDTGQVLKDNVPQNEPSLSTYNNEGMSEAWDNAWDEESDKMNEPTSDVQTSSLSGYSVQAVAGEMAEMTLTHQPTTDTSFSHPSVSEGSFSQPAVSDESYSLTSVSEAGYSRSITTEESYTQSTPAEESYTQSTVTEESYSHPPTSEESFSQHPTSSESLRHSTSEEPSTRSPSSRDSFSHPSTAKPAFHQQPLEGYHHPLPGEGTYSHPPVTEEAFTHPPPVTVQPPVNTHQSSMTYLQQGTERAMGERDAELHTHVLASSVQHVPSSQPSPSPPQQPSTYPTTHYLPQHPQEPTPHHTHHIHTTDDPHRLRESPHPQRPSPSPSPQQIPHHPSPSPSPHAPSVHPHHLSSSPSSQAHPHHPSPSPHVPSVHPHHPSPSPSPHASHPQRPHEASAQDVNLEVAPPPPHPAVPDPIFSRIPDGASSIPEGPAVSTGMSMERQGQGQSQAAEAPWQASSAGGSSGVSEGSAEYQPPPHPTHPTHPPHPAVERPASNQSAHSVHSVHSVHSIHSAHSTHSVHSSHSMTLNQEVPLDEAAETLVSSTSSTSPQGEHLGGLASGDGASASRPSWEGATVPSSLPPTMPQVPGPHGTVQSLKPRKGSPFQPPAGKDSAPNAPLPQGYQYFTPSQPSAVDSVPVKPPAAYPDVSANLETLPDNNELLSSAIDQSGSPLWSTADTMTGVKLTVAAPPLDTTPTPAAASSPAPPPSNAIPLVVPGLVKEERPKEVSMAHQQPPRSMHSDPPMAHNANQQAAVPKPKIQSFSSLGNAGTPSSPAVLDLSKSSRVPLEATTAEDRPQGDRETPNFSRMVPGESRKGESAAAATPAYQTPAVVPSMPSERVVTGNDNPQPVVAVGIKQEPSEVRSPPDGPDTSHLSSQAASVVVPPIRSETIGSEEPKLRNFTSGNSGSRSDLAGGDRGERNERGSGRWERDHSRDRAGDSGSHRGTSDRYRDRSRERGSTRDYYRDDSPHSRRSYDRDYDDRRRWRGRDSDEDEDSDRRYYDSRDRRERAYRDEMDRYSDRPGREDGKERREGSKRRDYKDRSKDSFRGGYDDDPYYGGSGRGDRSQPLSRSSSINNLDEADRSSHHLHHHHRSLHHHHHHHHPRDYYDPRDSRSRDSDPRDRDASYASRDHRDYYTRGWEGRDGRRDHQRYYGSSRGYEDMYELYHQYYPYSQYGQYYKDYYQWVKQYRQAYQSESFYDDRTSIHSGRSSVNNEPEKSVSSPRVAYDPYGYFYGPPSQPPCHSSQFLQDFHGTSALGHFEPSPIYPDGSLSQLKSYPSGELSGAPSVGDDTVSEAAPRMTPVHFGRPHITARFTPSGQLVMVLPKDPRDGEKAVVQLRNVQKMLCVDPSESRAVHLMKNYPGPLTLSDTHKDVVMKHCEHQAAEAGRSLTLPDKESVMLIWEYLALLVKQNGKLFGSDIAGLLLKGREVGPAPTHPSPLVEEPPDDVPPDTSPQDEGIHLPQQPPVPVPGRDEAALLRKFTEYLCLGRKKEAVDYAIREGLWGHALVLAYKMDTTTHTRVLSAFMSHIPRTDVVLTLLQQLSGKKPEITKSYSPQQWGDWRQHLAVMISNPTGTSHKDQASIVALGDTLAARGQLHAAHFCYLVAEVGWGSYTCKDSKLVLIGASHHLPFQAFATIEAIQCTEVYEFARSLDGSNSPPLDTFQSYKLVYALRLTECGFPAEALRYCEVISQAVEKNPTVYKVEFLSQVYDLASRLKYHDLHYQMYQGEVSEMPDPQWLTNLRAVLDAARQREHQQLLELQQDVTRTENIQSYSQMYPQTQATQESSQTVPVNPSYSVAENSHSHVPHMDPHGYRAPSSQPYQHHDFLYTGQPSPDVMDSSNYKASPHSPSKGGEAAPMNPSLPQGVMGLPQEEGPSAVETPMMSQPSPEHSQYGQDTTYQNTYQQQEPYLHPSSQSPSSYEQGSGGEQNMGTDTQLTHTNSQGGYPGYQEQQQPYQSWAPSQPQPTKGGGMSPPLDAPSKPTEPPAQQTQRTPEEEAYWAEMSNKKSGGTKETKPEEPKPEEDKKKSAAKESKTSNTNKGSWLPNWLGWKTSTPQAKLPDDKNPQIVWDDDKKKWVNKDGTEETTAPVGPPPKMPQVGRGPPPSVSRGGNRMTRYVDPVRDKTTGSPGTQPSPVLPPSMPMNSPSVSPSLMIPQAMQPSQESKEAGDTSPQPQPQPQQQQPPPVPEVAQGMSSEESRDAVPMMAPPMGQPQFFDPSQFKPSPGTPVNPARRAGPGRRSFPGNR